jgi:predicted oxidoreductase
MSCPRVLLRPGGPDFSRIVAGMWRLADWQMDGKALLDYIDACLELGVTTFDHADIYGDYRCEALFGAALAQAPTHRARLQLVSKCGICLISDARPTHRIKHYDTRAAHIQASVERSLAALQTDRLDLLLIHRPDPLMRYDEIAHTFERLQRDGKVLAFGVSNFSPAQFAALDTRIPLATNQVECSPLHCAPIFDGTFDQLQPIRVAPMLWSPLAGGRLFAGDGALQTLLAEKAAALQTTPTTLVYAWLMALPCHPLPLTGSRRIEVVREAVAACALELDHQSWYEILETALGHEVP